VRAPLDVPASQVKGDRDQHSLEEHDRAEGDPKRSVGIEEGPQNAERSIGAKGNGQDPALVGADAPGRY
jgi:hypothetical protein